MKLKFNARVSSPVTLSMKKIIKILAVTNILLWVLFFLIDVAWNDVVREAVSAGQKRYGEMYGPLSYFRPRVLYLALATTLSLSGSVFINRKKNIEDNKSSDPT